MEVVFPFIDLFYLLLFVHAFGEGAYFWTLRAFLVAGVPQQQMQQLLGAYCPNVLFPYAREAVSDIVGKGSFPQLLLAPVNFDALYAEALKRKTEKAKKESESASTH